MNLTEQQYERVARYLDGQDLALSADEQAVRDEIADDEGLLAPALAVPAEESLMAAEDLIALDVVRYLGISNVSLDQMERFESLSRTFPRARIRSVQNQFDILHGEDPGRKGVFDESARRGLSFIPWSPLRGGLLSNRYVDGSRAKPGDRLVDEKRLDKELRATSNPDHKTFYFLDGGYTLKVRWGKADVGTKPLAEKIEFVERKDMPEKLLDQAVDEGNAIVTAYRHLPLKPSRERIEEVRSRIAEFKVKYKDFPNEVATVEKVLPLLDKALQR